MLRYKQKDKQKDKQKAIDERGFKVERTLGVAQYFNELYSKNHDGKQIDEMRLHKLMYFAQKESLKEERGPLFRGTIEGWRLGPVVLPVHGAMKRNSLMTVPYEISDDAKELIESVYERYKDLSSWKLNDLTHEEISWMKSRDGKEPEDSSNERITVDEIRVDALIEKLEEKMGEVEYELYV